MFQDVTLRRESHSPASYSGIYAHFFSFGGLERLVQLRKIKSMTGQLLGDLGTTIFEDDEQDLKFDFN